jgi:aspartate aminotransferase
MQYAKRVLSIKPSPTLALNARAKKMQAEGVDVVNLTCGEPDFDTPIHIKKAAVDALDAGFTKYTLAGGIVELKDAVIRAIDREQGLKYTRDEIIITPGAKYAIYAAMEAILNVGDEVIIPAPYWVSYPDQTLLFESKPVIVETTEETKFKITAAQLEGTITPRSRILVLNSPSNPTGFAYTEAELSEIARVCVKHNLWVISDEIYDGIVFDGFKCRSIAAFEGMKERTILVNGVSKKYAMTGWRMGFAAANKELIAHMTNIQGQAITNVTSITQKACIAAYDGPRIEIDKMVKAFCERRNYIVDQLNRIGMKTLKPEGAFYAFPNVSHFFGKKFGGMNINSSSDFSEFLLAKANVATVPGSAFGTEGFIRLSYATSMEKIKEAITRIEKSII